jgi:hypothetical protein
VDDIKDGGMEGMSFHFRQSGVLDETSGWRMRLRRAGQWCDVVYGTVWLT